MTNKDKKRSSNRISKTVPRTKFNLIIKSNKIPMRKNKCSEPKTKNITEYKHQRIFTRLFVPKTLPTYLEVAQVGKAN